jgi:uncharacterized membrane protein
MLLASRAAFVVAGASQRCHTAASPWSRMAARFSPVIVALALAVLAAPACAALAALRRQEVRTLASGGQVVVCIYAAADGREFERVYPAGNFCPQYAEP